MLHVVSYKLCAKLLSCLFFPTFSALARWQNDALSEVLACKLGLCRERFPCVCLAVLLAEVVCNGQVDAGIFRFHPSFAHQEFRMPAAVITCCVQQVVRHQPYAQLLAEESLSGSQVEIAVCRLSSLRQLSGSHHVSVKLQTGVSCHHKVVYPPQLSAQSVAVVASFVGGMEVVMESAGVHRCVPPPCRLCGKLQFQPLLPLVAGIDDAVQCHSRLICPSDVIHHSCVSAHESRDGQRHIVGQCLAPLQVQCMDVF